MNRIFWFLIRLKKMSVLEYQYRLSQIVKKRIDKLFRNVGYQKTTTTNGASIKGMDISEFKKLFSSEISDLIEVADDILSHRFNIFSINKHFGRKIDWYYDPKTDNSWPMDFWGDINYRDGNSIGGIKFAWELNRLHHFPRLAIAYTITGSSKYKDEIFRQMESWLNANPYPYGINWIMGIELGIRIVNIVYTLKFLGDEQLTNSQQRLITRFIASHGRHLFRYPSKYSSGANHAIAEALGLFVCGLCFPNMDGADKWKKYGKRILETEITRQIYADGSSFEHSIFYLQFVLDHFLIYYLLCKEYNEPCGHGVEKRLKASFEFISCILDRNGNYPNIGDEDDGYLMRLWFGEHNNFVSLLNTGAVLFDEPKWILENSTFDQKTFFLLGSGSKLKWDELRSKRKKIEARGLYFKDAGLAIIRDTNKPEVLIAGNSGPLGLEPLNGHGHADALSFWLSVDGKSILIDPGTYLYHSGGYWRRYFRSTAAHNTIRVDGLDQATMVADFIFSNTYSIDNPICEEMDEKVLWSAGHDGYMRLKDPIFHKREVTYLKKAKQVIIKDYFECKEKHLIECFFHLHSDCCIAEKDNLFEIECGEIRIGMVVDEKWSPRKIIKGARDPLNGWYSPGFNRLQESYSLVLSSNIDRNESFYIKIYLT